MGLSRDWVAALLFAEAVKRITSISSTWKWLARECKAQYWIRCNIVDSWIIIKIHGDSEISYTKTHLSENTCVLGVILLKKKPDKESYNTLIAILLLYKYWPWLSFTVCITNIKVQMGSKHWKNIAVHYLSQTCNSIQMNQRYQNVTISNSKDKTLKIFLIPVDHINFINIFFKIMIFFSKSNLNSLFFIYLCLK